MLSTARKARNSLTIKRYPTVALVGRTNVGKSTLFNKLIESRRAIVAPQAHTTRDKSYGEVLWRAQAITVIDTGGIEKDERPNALGRAISQAAQSAIAESDVIAFVLDSKTGVLPADRMLASDLRRYNKPIIVVANKADRPNRVDLESYKALGLGTPIPVSGISGVGTGDFLDQCMELFVKLNVLPQEDEEDDMMEPETVDDDEGNEIRVAIIGRPNVGKSSLVNTLLGYERVIVSPEAHTTREPQDTEFDYKGAHLRLVDTAGLRRLKNVHDDILKLGMRRSEKLIEESDIALLVIPADERLTNDDNRIASIALEKGVSLVLVTTKWDLVKDKTPESFKTQQLANTAYLRALDWVPQAVVSSQTQQRVADLLDLVLHIAQERRKHIGRTELDRWFERFVTKAPKKPLKRQKGQQRIAKIVGLRQVGTNPPTFSLVVKYPRELNPAWVKRIEKALRQDFGFDGTPIRMIIRSFSN